MSDSVNRFNKLRGLFKESYGNKRKTFVDETDDDKKKMGKAEKVLNASLKGKKGIAL